MNKNRIRRLFLVIPLAAISMTAWLLGLPSNREKKIDRLGSAIESKLRVASPEIVTRIRRAHSFVARKPAKPIGTVYLFCPAGANVAELMRDGKNAELDNFEFRVLPTIDKDSPSSEMALALTMHEGTSNDIKWLEAVAEDPIGSKPKIAKAFGALAQLEKDTILAQMQANLKIHATLGRNDVMLRIGDRYLLGEDTLLLNLALNGQHELLNGLH